MLPASEKHLLTALCSLSALWAAVLVIRYWGAFGGDPEIHIIFAKNLLNGHFLEFNPGYKTGGETSPLYMLVVAVAIELFGRYVPYAMKAVGFISLGTICVLLYRANTAASITRRYSIAMLSLCMPFFVFQASMAMENMLFAAAVLMMVHLWSRGERRLIAISPILLPLLFFLRPEAVFLGIWLGCACLAQRDVRQVVTLGAALAGTVVFYLILNHYSGGDVQNAGHIRAYLSTLQAVHVPFLGQNVYINLKVLRGMIYLAPVLGYMAIRHQRLTGSDRIQLITLFLLPAALHLFNVLPNTQFSRYFLFEYAVVLYIFTLRFLADIETGLLVAIWVFVMGVGLLEAHQRESQFGDNVVSEIDSLTPAAVKKHSDTWITELQPERLPVIMATQEVQIRGQLDERFVIWSLDGITDRDLAAHLHGGYLDLFSYIKDRRIEFVLGLQNYNRDAGKPSLADFDVPRGTPVPCINGLRLIPTPVEKIYKAVGCTRSPESARKTYPVRSDDGQSRVALGYSLNKAE